jgi:ATP/maltotriose-dependent transcriptional regulator MalT
MIAQQTGWRGGEAFTLFSLGLVQIGFGNFQEAFNALAEGMTIAVSIDHHQWQVACHVGYGHLCNTVLAYEDARHHSQQGLELAQRLGSTYWIHVATTILSHTAIAQGYYDEAQSLISAYDSDLDKPAYSIAHRGLRCARARLALAQGDASQALQFIQNLVATEPSQTPDAVIPVLWMMQAQALSILGQLEEAVVFLDEARQTANRYDALPLIWQIESTRVQIYRAHGCSKEAEETTLAARAIMQKLAVGIIDPVMRERFLSHAEALMMKATE